MYLFSNEIQKPREEVTTTVYARNIADFHHIWYIKFGHLTIQEKSTVPFYISAGRNICIKKYNK